MTQIREVEMRHGKETLERIRQRESDLMAQNEKLMKGHVEVQKDVERLEGEINKPIKSEVRTEQVSSSERRTQERVSKKSAGMQEVGSQETTTSG